MDVPVCVCGVLQEKLKKNGLLQMKFVGCLK